MTNKALSELLEEKGYGFGKRKGGYDLWTGKGDNFKSFVYYGTRKQFVEYAKTL